MSTASPALRGRASDRAPDISPDVRLPPAAAALAELAEAYPVRVTGRQARGMVRGLRRRTGWSREDFRELWAHPESSFGPFADLPSRLRDALSDAVAWEMRERSFTTSERLGRAVHGPVFRLGSELAHRGRRIASAGRRWRRPGRGVYLCGRGLCSISERAGRAWLAATRFAGRRRTSGFHALWRWAGMDPMRPAIEYVRSVPCDPRLSPVYRNRERRVSSWMMVGLDLLPSGDDVYFIEANINPGFFGHRRWESRPNGDPLLGAMTAAARREGQKRVVVYPSSVAAFSLRLEEWWREQAAAVGIELEIRDDPRVRSPYRRPTDPLMAPDADRTLYVNVRTLPHPANVLLEEKGLFEAEIERHNARVAPEKRIAVPRRIVRADDLPAPDPEGRFPNVVVKHALLNEARDVRMYRVDRLDPALLRPPYVAFEFVPPDLELRSEDGGAGEYAIKYRVNLFVTPDGPSCDYVGKAIGAVPVPNSLAEGLVKDRRPYVVNNHTGGRHVPATQEEFERIGPAALRIGWLVHDFMRRLHGPDWPHPQSSERA